MTQIKVNNYYNINNKKKKLLKINFKINNKCRTIVIIMQKELENFCKIKNLILILIMIVIKMR